MFIAMNRFKVVPGSQADFEQVWTTRDTHLREVPGFMTFHLLRGPDREDHVLYSSHSIWRSRADFEAWTRSDAFRRAHHDAGSNKPLYLGHPEFEGFDVIQTVAASTTKP
jgi:heme-degrading monooxygenase HmoA